MVTFVCEYCDVTLKKNQCDKHVMGRCRPAALICIDCSKTYRGTEYKAHTSCISEMDKHWGQYAPSQKNNPQQNASNQNGQQATQQANVNTAEKEESKQTDWKGWKNQIKRAIVEESPGQKKVELQNLKKTVLKRYHEEFDQTDQDEKIFLQKLQKLKKVKTVTYITLV